MSTKLIFNRDGTSAVEFALLFPLFALVLMGMAAYGIYLGASHGVQQLTADAARTAVSGIDNDERRRLATSYIDLNATSYAFLDRANLSVTAAPSSVDPAQFVVSVRYDASSLPIWTLMRGLPLPGTVIQHRSTIRVGGA